MEYVSGNLISNRGDTIAPYDLYSTSGTLITPSFITPTTGSGQTGIAFDGTYYFVSEIFSDKFGVYDATGAFVKEIALTDGLHTNSIEDLSADYASRPDTGAPEPSTYLMLSGGLVAFCLFRKSRARA